MYYLHFTSYDNLPGILEKGLVPRIGERSKSVCDDRRAIFFSYGFSGAIRMYSSMKWKFSNHFGQEGLDEIEFHKKRIEEDQKYLDTGYLWDREETIQDIEGRKKLIDAIKYTMTFKSFNDYLKDGCYLSVDNFKKINDDKTKDCYVKGRVDSDRLFVVGIYSGKTGTFYADRDIVLAHFMSIVPLTDITENSRNVIEIYNIEDLYKEKANDIKKYAFDGDDAFVVQRVSLQDYLNSKESSFVRNRKRN